MGLTLKTQIGIKIFCIVLIFFLCSIIFIHSKTLSCDKCIINFESTKKIGNELYNRNFSTSLIDLSNNLSINKCLVTWDYDAGYKFNPD